MEPNQLLFLPAPREPLTQASDPPRGLHARIDGYVDAVAALRKQVNEAVRQVYDGRPGGAAWNAAADADQATIMSGKPLKAPALAALLSGDYSRWAAASAQCRTAVRRADRLLAELKADATEVAADIAADRLVLIAERRPMLRDAYETARDGSKGRALVAVEQVEPLNTRVALLGSVGMWLTAEKPAPLKIFAGSVFPFVETDPEARRDRGYWIAAQLLAGGVVTRIPDRSEVEWPDDFRDAERLKMPNSMQFGAVESARNGGPGVVFAPDLPETARRIGSLGLGTAPVGAQRPRRGR